MQGFRTNNINNNHNTNKNVNPISSQHASNYPSPTTPTPPPILPLFGTSDASNTGGSSLPNGLHHRQAYSDGSFRIAEDIVGLSEDPFHGFFSEGRLEEMVSEEELFSAFLDLQNLGQNEDGGGRGCVMGQDGSGGCGSGKSEKISRVRHRNSSFFEGSGDGYENIEEKKEKNNEAVTPEKLAEIWGVNPKRAKRILANRESAARSKEKKARYVSELERKFHTLQTEATNLSAQLKIYQRETMSLTTQNAKLKIRLQVMDQQAQLRDALNETLKQEVKRLKTATRETKTKTHFEFFTLGLQPYSPATSPSPSPLSLKIPSYNQPASPSPRTTENFFPFPKKSVPVLAQLPPFHNSQSGLTSHCLQPSNAPTLPEQESLSLLRGLDISNLGSNHLKVEGSGSDQSSSTTQLLTP